MKNCIVKTSTRIVIPALAILILSSCMSGAGLTGTWREVGSEATLEFSGDGTFRAVDNMGMAVAGTYSLSDDGTLRFVVHHGDGSDEVVVMKLSICGDLLTVTTPDLSESEQYRKER